MRERKKLIDWMLGLRPKEDYPYDATGALVAVSDTNKDGKEDGMQIYSLRDFIVKRCRQYGKIIQENLRTKVENSKSKIQKLAIEKYDSENYRTVMRQSRDLSRKLERKKRHKDKLELDYEQMSVLRKIFFQGPKIEHYFNDTRTETIIMNKEMYKNYSGEYIGHTSTYIAWRDQERELYLNNPALSEARKKERLRAEKKNIKKHQKTDRPAPEPSLAIIAKLLEDRLNIIFESP
jgi:hypothetical protein